MSFISVLKAIGRDIEKVFESKPFQEALSVSEAVVGLAFPAMGPIFNITAQAVQQAEANFAAIGQQSSTGAQKLAAVVTNVGNLIQVGLKDAGVANVTQAKVEQYISAVVTILNATPELPPITVTPGLTK